MGNRVADSKVKVRNLKIQRTRKTKNFKNKSSQNVFRRQMSKILESCKATRELKRKEADGKMFRLKKKYGNVKDEVVVPVEIQEYGECRVFQSDDGILAEESSGLVIVFDEGEE